MLSRKRRSIPNGTDAALWARAGFRFHYSGSSQLACAETPHVRPGEGQTVDRILRTSCSHYRSNRKLRCRCPPVPGGALFGIGCGAPQPGYGSGLPPREILPSGRACAMENSREGIGTTSGGELPAFGAWLRRHRGHSGNQRSRLCQGNWSTSAGPRRTPEQYNAALIGDVLLRRFEHIPHVHARGVAISTRMYLRFLTSSGACPPELAGAVPTPRRRRLASPPDRVPAGGVRAWRPTRYPAGRAGTLRLPRWAA